MRVASLAEVRPISAASRQRVMLESVVWSGFHFGAHDLGGFKLREKFLSRSSLRLKYWRNLLLNWLDSALPLHLFPLSKHLGRPSHTPFKLREVEVTTLSWAGVGLPLDWPLRQCARDSGLLFRFYRRHTRRFEIRYITVGERLWVVARSTPENHSIVYRWLYSCYKLAVVWPPR